MYQHSYLHFKSEHPQSVKWSTLNSQAVYLNKTRFKRDKARQNYDGLQKTFKDRGFEKHFIKSEIKKALIIRRTDLLK